MKYQFTLSLLLVTNQLSLAQQSIGTTYCAAQKQQHHIAAKPTVLSASEDNYDIKYVKLNLGMTNASTYISGDVTTNALVVAATLSQYVFELNNILTIDSIKFNGVLQTVATSGDLRTITLSQPLNQNDAFTVQVFYHGQPVSGTLQDNAGMNNFAWNSWGAVATYTLSESYEAKDWWPCKQSLTDKIDSADIWLTVPAGLKAGSNGVLQQVTAINDSMNRYEWKERNPIDYYLISSSVADYTEYSFYAHFTGSTDSMLIQNYLYNNTPALATYQSIIDSTALTIDYFSTLYGRYPFWREKYGHCLAPLGGGMEHQTMTTLGLFEGTLVAHELAHQWFGDNVTCGSWKDIFMNEGFAAYSEYLFTQHFRGTNAALQYIAGVHNNVISEPGGTVYVDDTTSEDRIFDSRLSYDKGAAVLHMLRFVANNDSLFFQTYKNYQQLYAGSARTTNDFKNVAAQTLNQNLDTFFNQWIYEEGYPKYAISWYQADTTVYIKINQATSVPASVNLFVMPAEIQLQSAQGDTTVRIYNNQATQLYTFTWNRTMSGLKFDPNRWLLYRITGLTHDSTLSVKQAVNADDIIIYPNPAAYSWQVDNIPNNSALRLTDITGNTVYQNTVNGRSCTINSENLGAGVYFLNIYNGNKGAQVYKLVKP